MIPWLLTQLEKNPTTTFSKRELLRQSEAEFARLSQAGLLTYVQSDPENETYPCNLPCAKACPKQIVGIQGRFYAICPEDSEIDPILLGEDDLHKYAFSVARLLEEIRKVNRLDGSLSHIEPDYHYVGHTTCDERRVGLVFVPSIKGRGLLELHGLRGTCTDDDILVVLSPVSVIGDISILANLGRENVVPESLAASLNFGTFILPIDRLIAAWGGNEGHNSPPACRVPIQGVTKWNEIFMEVVDDSTVKVRAGVAQWRKLTYVELGFKDERTGLSNKLWRIFLSLAEQNRRTIDPPRITPKDIQRLRNTLRSTFDLPGMPIKRYDQTNKRYPCHFHFADPRDWE